MQPVTDVLNQVAPNDTTPNDDSALLHDVTTNSWAQYNKAQKAELTLLQQVMDTPSHSTTP